MGNSDSKLQAPATPSESSSDEAASDPFAYVPLLPFSKKLTLQPPITVNRRNKTSTPRNGKSPPIKTKARKDAEKGKVLWKEDNWDLTTDGEKQCSFPKEMLECTAVGREI